MTLPAQSLIRRFRPHVWPQGFHKVRYYGLWSPVHRPLLHQRQLWLAAQHPPAPRASPDRESQSAGSTDVPLQVGQLGPSCGPGLWVVIRQLPRHQRGPPCATARPCGLPKSASAGPRVPETVASSHPSPLLPATMAGLRLPPPLATLDSHQAPAPSPLCPRRGITGSHLIRARLCFPSAAGRLKIPEEVVQRFRSTPCLCRLRATKTLLRWADVGAFK
jgi:hypothetical protein